MMSRLCSKPFKDSPSHSEQMPKSLLWLQGPTQYGLCYLPSLFPWFFGYPRQVPTPGSFHWLFLLPAVLLPQVHTASFLNSSTSFWNIRPSLATLSKFHLPTHIPIPWLIFFLLILISHHTIYFTYLSCLFSVSSKQGGHVFWVCFVNYCVVCTYCSAWPLVGVH